MIVNCTISGNVSADIGGGIYCDHYSYPTITNCTVSDNSARVGGGIWCHYYSSATITDCIVSGNSARYDSGGIHLGWYSNATITDCVITGNAAGLGWEPGFETDGGGGIDFYYIDPEAIVANCTITDNTAPYGGGIQCQNYYSSPTITDCTIAGNTAVERGGGICSWWTCEPIISNCIISGNTADEGGGIYAHGNVAFESATIIHCTITENTAVSGGGIAVWAPNGPTITNCILWNDSASTGPEVYEYSGSPVITYSDVQGGWPGTGNIDVDPLFVGGGDYHLMAGSPCIDTGTNAGIFTDMDGDVRPQGTGFDMGADEFVPGGCPLQIVPISHAPLTLYLVPALVAAFLGRRLYCRKRSGRDQGM